MPAAGGPARVLCSETGLGAGGTWSASGVILFGSDRGRLSRVEAAGGTCVVVWNDAPTRSARFPVFLPDGQHFLYLSETPGDAASTGVYLASLADAPGLNPRKILADRSSVVYAPPVVSQAAATVSNPQVAASVSNGTLVYLAMVSAESQLTWFDRSGRSLGTAGPRGLQRGVELSPDGNRVVTGRGEFSGPSAPWLYDVARATESRLFPSGTQTSNLVWFPDGRRLLFTMTSPAGFGVYQKDANGGSQPELMLPLAAGSSFVPSALSPDGRVLVSTVVDPKSRADIWYLPWEAKPDLGKAVKFVGTDADESQGQVSPDGKWIAYTTNETGVSNVYVRPFPTGPGVWRVSVDRGHQPRWSTDGKWLHYLRSLTPRRGTVMVAAVGEDERGEWRTGTPQALFDNHTVTFTIHQANVFLYSPHPDGQRFLVNAAADDAEATINVITNWRKTVVARKAS